jgi:uncharacterized repeat protein (TIGR01451 family)
MKISRLFNMLVSVFISFCMAFSLVAESAFAQEEVSWSGVDNVTVDAGTVKLTDGVTAAQNGQSLSVQVTNVKAAGDETFVFQKGMTELNAAAGAVYTVTYSAYAADDVNQQDPIGQKDRVITVNSEAEVQPKAASTKEQTEEQEDSNSEPVQNDSGDVETATHRLKWIDGTDNSEITNNGDSLSITPTTNFTKGIVQAQLDFSTGGHKVCAPYSIEIRIPYHIFYDRNGDPCDTLKTALPKYPNTSTESSFNYRIDTDTNEIVITNFEEVKDAAMFTTTMSWSFTPMDVANGYTHDDIQAKFTTKYTDDEGNAGQLDQTSDTLNVSVNTSAKLTDAKKKMVKQISKWRDEWGEKPADADDYFYLEWQSYYRVDRDSTQPYYVTIDEDTTKSDGIVGYYKDTGLDYYDQSFSDMAQGDTFVRTTDSQVVCDNYDDYEKDGQTYRDIDNFAGRLCTAHGVYYVCRYKKSKYTSLPAEVDNTINVTLHGIDGNTEEKSASASHAYDGKEYEYGGDMYSISKFWQYMSSYSYRDLLNGKDVPLQCYFFMGSSARGWSFTKDGNEYGKKMYTANFIDDHITFAGQRLQPGDYSFSHFAPRISTYNMDPDNGKAIREKNDETTEITIWYKTPENQEWTKLKTGTIEETKNVDLPDQTYAVKVSAHTKHYQVDINPQLMITLNSTDHVKQIINDELAKGKDSMLVRNINTLAVQDSTGEYVDITQGNQLSTSVDRAQLAAEDRQNFNGHVGIHADAYNYVIDYPYDQDTTKSVGNPVSDPVHGREILHYTLKKSNEIKALPDVTSAEEIKEKTDFIDVYTNGTFYDLLPKGCYYLEGNTTVKSNLGDLTKDQYDVETVNNWKDTGRTMVIVHVHLPEDAKNYSSSSGYRTILNSYLKVSFDAYYPWTSIVDYGKSIQNSYAYENSTDMRSGTNDNGGYTANKDVYTDLDGNGKTDDNKKYSYSFAAYSNFSVEFLAQSGYYKRVKAENDNLYGETAHVQGGGQYEYQLRYVSKNNGNTKGLIMYDTLEDAYGENTYWKGKLLSIDTSQLESKGIKPVVYYSTLEHIDPQNNPGQADVSNSAFWSTTKPSDPSKITAIAVDMRYKENGEEYIFGPSESAVVLLHMKAPTDVSKYVDPQVYAYNDATVQEKFWSKGEQPPATASLERSHVTKVDLEPQIEIHKDSDPETGTKEDPTVVETDKNLTYTLHVTNKLEQDSIKDVEVTDPIPDGLTIDTENIQYYTGDDPADAKAVNDDAVQMTKTDQKLVFQIAELKGGQTVHLVIPTIAKSKVTYDNTAKITSIGDENVDITSETTHHKRKFKDSTLTIKKTVGSVQKDADKEFTFTVNLMDAEGKADTGTYDYEITKDGASVSTGTIQNGGTIKLKDGEQVTIKKLPGDAKYTVKEETLNGYTTTIDGKTSDQLKEGEETVVSFTNYKHSTVKFRKLGEDEPLAGAKLEIRQGNKTLHSWTSTTEDKSFALEKGEYQLVETESPRGWYKADPITFRVNQDGSVEIKQDGSWAAQDEQTIVMDDPIIPTGSLTIKKTVGSVQKEADKEFTFTVDLKDADGKADTGTYDYEITKDGASVSTGTIQNGGTIKLKDGEQATIKELLIDTKYTVKEETLDGYTTTIDGKTSDKIKKDENTIVSFTNYKHSTVKFRKLGEDEPLAGAKLEIRQGDNTLHSWTSTTEDKSFVLEKGEYQLVETESPKGWYKADPITFRVNQDGSVEIKQDDSWAAQGEQTIVMDDPIIPTGSLTIHKSVTGTAGDKTKKFPFTVTLTDADGNELTDSFQADGKEFKSGDTIELADGDSVTIEGIPEKTKYVVTESDNKEYDVSITVNGQTVDKAEGTIVGDDEQDVAYVNDRPGTELTVTKRWKNTPKTPQSVKIQLYRNGKPEGDPIELTAAQNWTYTWTGLDAKQKWSVDEVNVPKGYKKSTDHQGSHWTITNTGQKKKTVTRKSTKHKGSRTGLFTDTEFFAVMAVLAILGYVTMRKRRS